MTKLDDEIYRLQKAQDEVTVVLREALTLWFTETNERWLVRSCPSCEAVLWLCREHGIDDGVVVRDALDRRERHTPLLSTAVAIALSDYESGLSTEAEFLSELRRLLED